MPRENCRLIAGAGLVLVAAAFGRVATPVAAQDQPLPTPRQIVDRHVAAIGGEAAFRAVQSMRVRGRIAMPAQGIAGDIEVLSARPARLLYRTTIPGLGRIENGYDGKIGWSLNPVAGPELLTGRQLAEAADDAWFDATLHEAGHVREMSTLGRELFDDKPAFKVRVILASGSQQFEYFDVATGLQLGSEAVRATPQGAVQTVNILREYKRLGSLLQATVFVQRALGFEQVVTITSCEYNVVPGDAFDPPPAVRALVGR